jgi:hypothetical protein
MKGGFQDAKFRMYCDPGHSWLGVSFRYLRELGLIEQISNFSYYKGGTAYLEEDCDAPKFLKAFEQKYGYKPVIREFTRNSDSPIRRYNPYTFGAK